MNAQEYANYDQNHNRHYYTNPNAHNAYKWNGQWPDQYYPNSAPNFNAYALHPPLPPPSLPPPLQHPPLPPPTAGQPPQIGVPPMPPISAAPNRISNAYGNRGRRPNYSNSTWTSQHSALHRGGYVHNSGPNNISDTMTKKKKRKKPLSQNIPVRTWSVQDALRALEVEKEYNQRNKHFSLIIKFPDEDLSRDVVMKYDEDIANVHFQQPCTPRFCFVTLKQECTPEKVIERLNKIPFGNGFLQAEFKRDRDDDFNLGPQDIDPTTLFVGNLAQEVTKEDMLSTFPKVKRIDIGFAKKMKFTRYAFVSFRSIDDCIKAFKATHRTLMYSKSLIVRFRRLHGNVGMPGDPGIPCDLQVSNTTDTIDTTTEVISNKRPKIEVETEDYNDSKYESLTKLNSNISVKSEINWDDIENLDFSSMITMFDQSHSDHTNDQDNCTVQTAETQLGQQSSSSQSSSKTTQPPLPPLPPPSSPPPPPPPPTSPSSSLPSTDNGNQLANPVTCQADGISEVPSETMAPVKIKEEDIDPYYTLLTEMGPVKTKCEPPSLDEYASNQPKIEPVDSESSPPPPSKVRINRFDVKTENDQPDVGSDDDLFTPAYSNWNQTQ